MKGYIAKDPELAAALEQKAEERAASDAQAVAEQARIQQREAEKQQEIARKRAAEEEAEQKRVVAQNRALTEAFRKGLKVGSESHCGLVMAVNGPVATVQAPSPIGQYGLKISQLYPPGLAACRFFNGTYQDPGLPY